MKRRLIRYATVCVVGLLAVLVAPRFMASTANAKAPSTKSASDSEVLSQLKSARHMLETADADYDGHRVKAIDEIRAAIHAIETSKGSESGSSAEVAEHSEKEKKGKHGKHKKNKGETKEVKSGDKIEETKKTKTTSSPKGETTITTSTKIDQKPDGSTDEVKKTKVEKKEGDEVEVKKVEEKKVEGAEVVKKEGGKEKEAQGLSDGTLRSALAIRKRSSANGQSSERRRERRQRHRPSAHGPGCALTLPTVNIAKSPNPAVATSVRPPDFLLPLSPVEILRCQANRYRSTMFAAISLCRFCFS
jgi:hypothetical protein